MQTSFVFSLTNFLVSFASDSLLSFMTYTFFLGVMLRTLIYYTIKREDWFAREFEKRAHRFIDTTNEQSPNFFTSLKVTLEKTYYEMFEVRAIMKRRKPDYIMSVSDRIFLIQHGCALLVKDTLKQSKYLVPGAHRPKLLELSKTVFQNNSCFKKLFGLLPIGLINDVLNILPGIFIVGGIFGTFLGIMRALPELGAMDLANAEGTKLVMDQFLVKISFSMSTSILGIVFSVLMTMTNTLFSPEKLFLSIVERFENSLDIMWNRCACSTSATGVTFDTESDDDGDDDSLIELAQDALEKQLMKDKAYKDEKNFENDSSDDDGRESIKKVA